MTSGDLPGWIEFALPISIGALPLLLLVALLLRKRRKDRLSAAAERATPGAAVIGNRHGSDTPPAPSPSPVAQAEGQSTPPARPKDSKLDIILLVIFVVGPIISAGVYVVSRIMPDYRIVPPSMPALAERLDDYTKIPALRQNLTTKTLTGKAVIVDKDKSTLHPLMRGLPASIKATAPEDVDFVIWIDGERLSNTEFEVSMSVKPTPEQIAEWTRTHPAGTGIPTQTIAEVPVYKARWTVSVIDLAKKEVKAAKSFVGPNPPQGELDFGWPSFSGHYGVYVDNKLVKGCEVLLGDKGGIQAGSKRVVGVVAPVPWDEALAWIEQVIKPHAP